MTGEELRKKRTEIGLSQAKLAELTGIDQWRISGFELNGQKLGEIELSQIQIMLDSLDIEDIKRLKKKRYQNSDNKEKSAKTRFRRNYERTPRNQEYIELLRSLEKKFHSSEKTKYKAASFFAGAGGLCYGIRAAGFQIVATNELVQSYKEIYKNNFQNPNFLTDDIRLITEDEIRTLTTKHPNIDLIVGGPPCQGFSLSGKRDTNDARNNLFHYYLLIAKQIMPKVILMENVRLLTSMKDPNGKFVKERVLDTFKEIGYNSKFFNVNAKNFGVPQHRERVIFLALRDDINLHIEIPDGEYGLSDDLFNRKKAIFTFGDAVSDLEFLESGEKSDKDEHHWAVNHPEHVINWLFQVPQGKSAHENSDPSMRPPSGYNTTYKRQIWKEPASTVATTYGMISGCRNVHPIATRSLTTREALRFQSFPNSFKVSGTNGDIRTVIGNAVPPILGYELAKFIRDTYLG